MNQKSEKTLMSNCVPGICSKKRVKLIIFFYMSLAHLPNFVIILSLYWLISDSLPTQSPIYLHETSQTLPKGFLCLLGCVRTRSDNASDKRQNCRFSCRVKLSFRKINGNRRKCAHRTCATSDKILNFYNFMRALLRQATVLSLALSLPVRSHPYATKQSNPKFQINISNSCHFLGVLTCWGIGKL